MGSWLKEMMTQFPDRNLIPDSGLRVFHPEAVDLSLHLQVLTQRGQGPGAHGPARPLEVSEAADPIGGPVVPEQCQESQVT